MKRNPTTADMSGKSDPSTGIWFVRHAPVKTRALYGQMDVMATTPKPAHLHWLKQQLPKQAIWISSDLERCIRLAEALGSVDEGQQQLAHRLAGLREQHFGQWQGREYSEIEAADPEFYKRFWADPVRTAPPQGESFMDTSLRIGRCLSDIVMRHAGRQIVCFCHAGTVRAGLAMIGGMGPEAALNFAVDPLSISKIDYFDPENTALGRVDFINLNRSGPKNAD